MSLCIGTKMSSSYLAILIVLICLVPVREAGPAAYGLCQAPNVWFLNIFDFSLVDCRILALLQEWVCQHPMRDVDKLR